MSVGVQSAGLCPTRTTLANGIVVLTKRTSKTPAVTIGLSVRAGSVCDPPHRPGAMYLLSRVIDRGTVTRSASDIAETLDDRGTSLTIGVTRHLFTLTCTCLADDVEAILCLLGDVITSPTIPLSELETRRAEVVTLLRQDEDNPAVRAVEGLMALLYGLEHPYGWPLKGTIDAVERITREDLITLRAARFAPALLTAAIVGDVESARATDACARAFGDWRAAVPRPVSVASVEATRERRRMVISMPNKAQADVAYGFIGIPRSDPSYYAVSLMNNALGQYALGGRLGDSIRERQGMAYYVSSAFDANVVAGPLMVRAGVSAVNVNRAIASIDEELDLLRGHGLTTKELRESQQYMIGSLPRALETNAAIAQFLLSAEFFGLGLDSDVRLPSLLRDVTLEEANAAAQRILDPARATIAIAGPYEER